MQDVEVTQDDQLNINTFSRLNLELTQLEESLGEKKVFEHSFGQDA
jgi:hypothetical protein